MPGSFRSTDTSMPSSFQDREQFSPLLVPPQTDEPWATGVPVQRSPHGVGQERGEVVDRGPAVDVQVGQERAALLGDDHPEVVVSVCIIGLGKRLEVGLPGLVDLGEPIRSGS